MVTPIGNDCKLERIETFFDSSYSNDIQVSSLENY